VVLAGADVAVTAPVGAPAVDSVEPASSLPHAASASAVSTPTASSEPVRRERDRAPGAVVGSGLVKGGSSS
jgi:hypothetical protein